MTAPSGEPGLDPNAAPATPPAPGVPAPAPTGTGTPTPQPGQDPNEPGDIASLPPWAQKTITDLRKEAGGHRQVKNAAQQEAETAKQQRDAVLKALGLDADGKPAKDPAAAAAELAQRASHAENAAWGATVKLEIFQRAGKLGADPHALLDSLTFVDSLDELADADPTSAEFATALAAKITDAVTKNPALRAASGGAPAGGVDFTGGGTGGPPRTYSREQLRDSKFFADNRADIMAAMREGRIKE